MKFTAALHRIIIGKKEVDETSNPKTKENPREEIKNPVVDEKESSPISINHVDSDEQAIDSFTFGRAPQQAQQAQQ
ncbi:hypothetical protein X282_04190, partial [Oenococcus oeni IOEB_0608]